MKNRITGQPQLASASLKAPRKQKVYVWRLKGKEKGTVEIFSPDFHGFTVHFNPRIRRSCPHFDDVAECRGCQDQLPTKEVYYLFGWHVEDSRLVFLEITRAVAEKMKSKLAPDETFRGLVVHLERTTANNGRLEFRFINNHAPIKKLLPDRSPQEALFAMWGIRFDPPQPEQTPPHHGNEFFSTNGHQ